MSSNCASLASSADNTSLCYVLCIISRWKYQNSVSTTFLTIVWEIIIYLRQAQKILSSFQLFSTVFFTIIDPLKFTLENSSAMESRSSTLPSLAALFSELWPVQGLNDYCNTAKYINKLILMRNTISIRIKMTCKFSKKNKT